MSLSSKVSLALRCSVTLFAGLALTDCVVRTTPIRTAGTINVQPGTATVNTQPVYVQQQQQPVYVQQQQQPVYVQQQPVYAAPQPVTGVSVNAGVNVGGVGMGMAVGSNWVTDGYAQNDFVSYNMSMRARQFASGFMPVTQLYRAQMGQGQRQFVTVQIAPGRCYRIIGVGGPGVQDLDLRMRDMSGNVVDQDVATDNFPVLGLQRQLCPSWTGNFQVEIIMYSGGGDVGVQAFATQ
jgi:hypothetical protein